MTAISYDGAMTTGHKPYPPTKINASQSKVFVNGKAVLVNGDEADNHGHSNPGKCIASQSKVFVNGKAVIQVGDKLTDDDNVAQGSSNVFIK